MPDEETRTMPETSTTPLDFDAFIEDINDEYEFDEEPTVEPAKPEPPRRAPVSPVVSYHRKTMRNSYMLVFGGAIAAILGAFIVGKGGLNAALGIFLAALGIGCFAVGFLSVNKTKKLIHSAQRAFARDRAIRIYQKCVAEGIMDSESEEEQRRILQVANAYGFDKMSESVGLFNAGKNLVLKGEKPDPDLNDY